MCERLNVMPFICICLCCSSLNYDLFRNKPITDSSLCTCNQVETTVYFLLYCKTAMFSRPFMSTNSKQYVCVQSFIISTKRFDTQTVVLALYFSSETMCVRPLSSFYFYLSPSHIFSYYHKQTCITYVYSTVQPNYLDHIYVSYVSCVFSQLTIVS